MNCAVIVAAGQSKRFGRDKLWLRLDGLPVVAHTLHAFLRCRFLHHVVLVVNAKRRERFARLLRTPRFAKHSSRITITVGGAERQDSVWHGIQACPPRTTIIAIHDAARPCVTPALIHRTIAAAKKYGAAIAAAPIADTIKESTADGTINRTIPRDQLWGAQTPQTFRADVIRRAYSRVIAQRLRVTDDAAAVELFGHPVRLVSSDSTNLKITRPADLGLAEYRLSAIRKATQP